MKEPQKALPILKKEYPLIYKAYKDISDEQFELFAKKHLDYGMGNVSVCWSRLYNIALRRPIVGLCRSVAYRVVCI